MTSTHNPATGDIVTLTRAGEHTGELGVVVGDDPSMASPYAVNVVGIARQHKLTPYELGEADLTQLDDMIAADMVRNPSAYGLNSNTWDSVRSMMETRHQDGDFGL